MIGSRSRFPVSPAAILTFVTGIVLTGLLFAWVSALERNGAQAQFERRANLRFSALRQGLDEAVQTLAVLNQLFVTVGPVSREQFRTFTQPLLRRHAYIQAFNFHRYLSDAERPAYEAEMRMGNPGFAMSELVDGKPVPAQVRDRYSVVDYLEPMQGNEPAFGLNVLPNKSLTAVMYRAIDSGKPAASGLVGLAQGKGSKRGFLIVMPVYRQGAGLGDVAARREATVGDTAAVFLASAFVENILNRAGLLAVDDLDLRVFAGDSSGGTELVFGHAGPASGLHSRSWLKDSLFWRSGPTLSRSFEIAGSNWHMDISPAPGRPTGTHLGSLLILIAGLSLSLLGAAYMQALTSRSRRVERVVDERTVELNQANLALQLRERAIEASSNAIMIASAQAPDYPIEYVNPAFERITGYSAAEVIGRSSRLLQRDDRDQHGIQEIRAALRDKREVNAILRNYRKDGTLFWNDLYIAPVTDRSGQVSHFVAAQNDITSMKNYEEELEHQANHDALTGLANRSLLDDRLQQAIGYAARYEYQVWVVFIDLDRFKVVNDSLGHKAGDRLLNVVAERLHEVLRDTDTVARLGGDEFVLVLPERLEEKLTVHVVQRVLDTIVAPVTIDGNELFLTCSAGIAVYPVDGLDPEPLIEHADIAMYRAKERGRNNYQFYTPEMNQRARERLRLEGDLRSAIERAEFVLHYQPQVDLPGGRIVGMEALIRWQHPELGLLAPARFINLAEETGLIVPIGAWVLRTACAQAKAWQLAGHGDLRIAVNLSARQFSQQDLAQSILAVLEETGLAPHCLEIELTESLVMEDVEDAIGILRQLKAVGVLLSIDDFGTGYSSLSYLKRFPIDVLKIDQSFVRDITLDPDDAAIVLSIISLAHNLKLLVIAEGVETREQLDYLARHGCSQMQGYYFSQPVPAKAFEQLLSGDGCLPIRQG
jgi:diguanylate cyclase (GGDEF)-like protein/PAS domain S-box-containing protein